MWGPGASAGFQNALLLGQQSGNNIMQAFQQGRQMAEQREYRNALAQFDPSKPETLNAVMQVRPEVGLQLRGQVQQQQALAAAAQQKAAEARRADLPTMIKLLETATDEQTYQRNVGAARQFGIDTSTLPQTFDPAWRDSRLQVMKAIATPEGQEVLSTAGKQAADEGFRPGTPEFQARTKEIWQQSGAIPYTGENGETRLYVPGRGVPTQQPVSEGTVIENAAGEQMILRNGKWEAMPKGGAGGSVSGNF